MLRVRLQRVTRALKREIAGCRRVEDALRRSRGELETIVDSSPAMIFYKDRRNRFVRVNRAFAEAAGRRREEIEGRPVARLYPRHAARYGRDDREVIASGRPKRNIIEPLETKRGVRWVRTDKVPFRDRRGGIKGVIGFAVDVTDLLAASRQLEHLASFPALNPNPVLEVGRRAEVIFCNPAGLRAARRLCPRRGARAFVPRDFDALLRGLGGRMRARAYREVRLGGRLFGENIHSIPRFGTWRIYAFDITARRRAEEALRAHRERLEEAVENRTVSLRAAVARLREEIGRSRETARRIKASNDLLGLLGKAPSRREYLEGAARILKRISGCGSVGIRVAGDGGAVSYEALLGFGRRFKRAESPLALGRDSCVCTRVIAGAPSGPDRAAMTPGGSFRCDDVRAFGCGLAARARRSYRGVCAQFGYSSVAVIPVRHKGITIGAVHLADRRRGRVPAGLVTFVESLAALIGEGIRKFGMEERIEKEHAALEAFFAHTINPLVFLDREFNFIRVNKAYARACARPVSDFPGRNHFDLYPSDTKALFERVVRTKKPLQVSARPFTFADHPEWGVTYWDWSLVPILDAGGKIDFLVFSLRDVTEQLRAQEDLLKTQRTLAEARRLSDIGTLASTVAHELRNPLGVIRLAAHNIRRKSADRSLDAHLESIEKKIVESDQIINNLLYYSRINPPQRVETEIGAILEECVAQARRRHARPGIVVRLDPRGLGGCAVEADPVQLAEVFHNLLNNAFEAIQGSRGRIEVTAARDRKTGAVMVRVADSGGGIPEEALRMIREPFFTTKARGTGLGLTVSSQIVALHGGSIDVASAPGKGAAFTVTLPPRAPERMP